MVLGDRGGPERSRQISRGDPQGRNAARYRVALAANEASGAATIDCFSEVKKSKSSL